ncbi:MAG TPA: NADH-quinone oxidoreductase subunit J [Phycisphaerae bacterium]
MSGALASWLYPIFALAAAATYLLLPGERRTKPVGALLGLAALAAFIVLIVTRVALPASSSAYFCVCGAVAILATVRVITHDKPVYCVVYFVLVVLAVAFLLVVQQAEFLAVALVIIYAGAILVTYVFVLMLAQQSGAPVYDRRAREPLAAVFVGFILMAAVAARAADLPAARPAAAGAAPMAASATGQNPGNTLDVGTTMMTRYIIVFEVAGLLLLVAMIGAIALARKRVPADEYFPPPPEPGVIGRQVAPF